MAVHSKEHFPIPQYPNTSEFLKTLTKIVKGSIRWLGEDWHWVKMLSATVATTAISEGSISAWERLHPIIPIVVPVFSPVENGGGVVKEETTQNSAIAGSPETTVSLSEQERKTLREQIIKFQGSIGIYKVFIPGDPMYDAFIAQRKEWGGANDGFQNQLPNNISPFGDLAKLIADEVFQDTSGRLIKGARIDPGNHDQLAFNHSTDRYILFYEGIADAELDYISLGIIHELIGHGSDPEFLKDIYPYDTFLQLESLQWELLSKVASVPGAFINDSSNVYARELAISVGQAVGNAFLTGKVVPGSTDAQQITQLLEASYKLTGTNNRAVLNSKVSYQFGAELLRQISAGKIHLPEETREAYATAWFDPNQGNHRSEIYADMISEIIMKPDLSPELFEVCQRILRLLSQGKQTGDIGQQVTARTQAILSQVKSNSPQTGETINSKRTEENFQCFISSEACAALGHGFLDIPGSALSEEIAEDLLLLRNNLLKVYAIYPELRSTNSLHTNPDFSPSDLTPEKADQLRYSADPNFIRRLLATINAGSVLTDSEKISLKAKATALNAFMKSRSN